MNSFFFLSGFDHFEEAVKRKIEIKQTKSEGRQLGRGKNPVCLPSMAESGENCEKSKEQRGKVLKKY